MLMASWRFTWLLDKRDEPIVKWVWHMLIANIPSTGTPSATDGHVYNHARRGHDGTERLETRNQATDLVQEGSSPPDRITHLRPLAAI